MFYNPKVIECFKLRQLPCASLLLSVIALASVAASAAEFRIREAPYGQFNVKVIELTGDIVSGDSNQLKALFDANFKCGDYAGDCNPHSALPR